MIWRSTRNRQHPTQTLYSVGVCVSINSVKNTDLETIESFDLASGYHGVYPRESGNWCAKPYAGYNIGSTYPTARHAAIAVVQWWKANFGEDWVDFYNRRQDRPYRIVKISCKRSWYRTWDAKTNEVIFSPIGYRLTTWIIGVETVVASPIRPLGLFASTASARAFLPRWLKREFGLFADVAVSTLPLPKVA